MTFPGSLEFHDISGFSRFPRRVATLSIVNILFLIFLTKKINKKHNTNKNFTYSFRLFIYWVLKHQESGLPLVESCIIRSTIHIAFPNLSHHHFFNFCSDKRQIKFLIFFSNSNWSQIFPCLQKIHDFSRFVGISWHFRVLQISTSSGHPEYSKYFISYISYKKNQQEKRHDRKFWKILRSVLVQYSRLSVFKNIQLFGLSLEIIKLLVFFAEKKLTTQTTLQKILKNTERMLYKKELTFWFSE